MTDTRLIYVTADGLDEARRIGTALIEERLAACVNLIEGMRSLYHWQGAVEEGREVIVLAKTRADLVDRLTARVVTLHSYDCPCVVSVPIDGGHPPFLAWIAEETRTTP